MMRTTISLDGDLYAVLVKRAEFNRRSLSGEILYLIECALAGEIESNQHILRTLLMAQGGSISLLPVEAELHLGHTAKDGFQP